MGGGLQEVGGDEQCWWLVVNFEREGKEGLKKQWVRGWVSYFFRDLKFVGATPWKYYLNPHTPN